MKIKRCVFNELKSFVNIAKKERVTMFNSKETIWFAAYSPENEIMGFVSAIIGKGFARLKSDFILKKYRGKGIYNKLFEERFNYLKTQKIEKVNAFCTPLSLPQYLKYGFIIKTKIDDRVFVERIMYARN